MLEEKSQGLNKKVRDFVDGANNDLYKQLNNFGDQRDALGVLVTQLIVNVYREVDVETAVKYLDDIFRDVLACLKNHPYTPGFNLENDKKDERKS